MGRKSTLHLSYRLRSLFPVNVPCGTKTSHGASAAHSGRRFLIYCGIAAEAGTDDSRIGLMLTWTENIPPVIRSGAIFFNFAAASDSAADGGVRFCATWQCASIRTPLNSGINPAISESRAAFHASGISALDLISAATFSRLPVSSITLQFVIYLIWFDWLGGVCCADVQRQI